MDRLEILFIVLVLAISLGLGWYLGTTLGYTWTYR